MVIEFVTERQASSYHLRIGNQKVYRLLFCSSSTFNGREYRIVRRLTINFSGSDQRETMRRIKPITIRKNRSIDDEISGNGLMIVCS